MKKLYINDYDEEDYTTNAEFEISDYVGNRIVELFQHGEQPQQIVERMVEANYTREYSQTAVELVIDGLYDAAVGRW